MIYLFNLKKCPSSTNEKLSNFTEDLFNTLYVDNDKAKELLELGFTKADIYSSKYLKIKRLIELYHNPLGIEFISKDELRNIISKSTDWGYIVSELEKRIDLSGKGQTRVFILINSILYR